MSLMSVSVRESLTPQYTVQPPSNCNACLSLNLDTVSKQRLLPKCDRHTTAAAGWVLIALALAQKMYQTNLLIAGWDEKTGPSLFWLDYLATMHPMNVAGTGYGALQPFRAECSKRCPGWTAWPLRHAMIMAGAAVFCCPLFACSRATCAAL